MKRFLIVGVLGLYSVILHAEVKVSSLHFGKEDATPTFNSKCELSRIKDLMESYHVQIIEVNSFSDLNTSAEANEKLCLLRQNFILDYFDVKNENIIANIYGKKRVALNFTPSSWNRVDVYYFVGEKIMINTHVAEPVLPNISAQEKVVAKRKASIRKGPITNVPVVLPIMFEGGTQKVRQESVQFLDSLYFILHENKRLKVHIRGHVCCSNRPVMSKKRAKLVYKFLIDKGIAINRLTYKGYSNELPLVFPEITEADRQKNRRVDIIFSQ